MAEFRTLKIVPRIDFPVHVNRTAYGVAQGQINRVTVPVDKFRQRRAVGVIFKGYRIPDKLADHLKFHVVQMQYVGTDDQFPALVDYSRYGDADSQDLIRRGTHVFQEAIQLLRQCLIVIERIFKILLDASLPRYGSL